MKKRLVALPLASGGQENGLGENHLKTSFSKKFYLDQYFPRSQATDKKILSTLNYRVEKSNALLIDK